MSKDFTAIGKTMAEDMGNLGKAAPEFMGAFKSLGETTVGKNGALSHKTKEMIAVAIGIAARCDGCIAHHTKACIDAGVTREEFVEIIGSCVMMGGGPSAVYGAEALKAYDQWSSK